jgi:RNA polymerase sigma factor (TIGR02999 family)
MEDSAQGSQQITLLLTHWRHGDAQAGDRIFRVIYSELRKIAARFLHSERDHQTLEPNALVSELWLRLVGADPRHYENRAHFFALAANTMRRILIDQARARKSEKRGGLRQRVTLTAVEGWDPIARDHDILWLDQALSKLEKADPRAARVVELRYFGGLEEQEVAEVLGVSAITVKRDWKFARAWLMARLSPGV